jgi:hypothetical protein
MLNLLKLSSFEKKKKVAEDYIENKIVTELKPKQTDWKQSGGWHY